MEGTSTIHFNKILPHPQLTFLDYPSYHHHLHHPHLHPRVAQTQSLFANIPATTCMQLDTPHCHSELLNMKMNMELSWEHENQT